MPPHDWRRKLTRNRRSLTADPALTLSAALADIMADPAQRAAAGFGGLATEDAVTDASVVAAATPHFAPIAHVHTLTPTGGEDWAGRLAGSGVTDLQSLADWIDANI